MSDDAAQVEFRSFVTQTLTAQNKTLAAQNETLAHLRERADKTCLTLHGADGRNGMAMDVHDLKEEAKARKWWFKTVAAAVVSLLVAGAFAATIWLIVQMNREAMPVVQTPSVRVGHQ